MLPPMREHWQITQPRAMQGAFRMSEAHVGEISFASDKTIEIAVADRMVVMRVIDIDVEIITKMTVQTAARLATYLSTASAVAQHPYAIENMIRAQQ